MTDQIPRRRHIWHVKSHECTACDAELSVDAFEIYYRDGDSDRTDPDNVDLFCGDCHDRLGEPSPARVQTEAVLVEIEAAMPAAARDAVLREYLGRSRFNWTLGS